MKPEKPKLQPLRIKHLTCLQLRELLLLDSSAPELSTYNASGIKKLVKLRKEGLNLGWLKICGHRPASQRKSLLRAVDVFLSAPIIRLSATCGQPDESRLPKWSRAAAELADENGRKLERWGAGAFYVAKP